MDPILERDDFEIETTQNDETRDHYHDKMYYECEIAHVHIIHNNQ